MIVFHEGLPGAGKSYEACLYHILPALKAGRRVVTNIEGINHQKFSETTGIPVNLLEAILISISHEDITNIDERVQAQKESILEHSEKDNLIVLDEIQDLFPSERQKLPTVWINYVASHRHEGLDIILMGQDFRDMHSAWRRRTQRKIVFTKQTAVGLDTRYLWVAYEAISPEKFKKISSGTRKYDSKSFGYYKSHTAGTENKNVYSDDRINIFKTPGFKYGIPIFIGVLFYAGNHLSNFFSPENSQIVEAAKKEQISKPQPLAKPQQIKKPPSQLENSGSVTEPDEYHAVDEFDRLANQYRPRLSGILYTDKKLLGRVEILDSSFHRKDVFTIAAIREMGWDASYSKAGLELKKGDVRYLVRPWPVDAWGRVNKGTVDSFGRAGEVRATTAKASTAPPKSILIEHEPRARSSFERS